MNREQLTRADWLLIAACVAVAAVSIFVVVNWFGAAFPEASIEFRYDRGSSEKLAESVLAEQLIDTRGMKHSATFESDDEPRIFLERSLGLKKTNEILKHDVRLWAWSHRWFRPLQEEEFRVDIAPTGEVIGFSDRIPEDRAIASPDVNAARSIAERFLGNINAFNDRKLVAQSARRLPKRMQRIFTWDSQSIHPAGAPYRTIVTVDGDRVSSFSRRIKVPEDWQRSYRELRSKNNLAGNVDILFFLITGVCIVAVFVIRLLRGDLQLRLLLGIGIAAVVLVTGNALNSWPSVLAGYNTTESYAAFLSRFAVLSIMIPAIGTAMLLIVVVGAGEVLFRERLPNKLSVARIWNRRALTSKRVFLAFIVGYTLVAFFLGYQVAFYLIADKFGAWAPAEVPYDDMLNTAFPWIAVLFAGFFPALSEEFMSRAFSIPFFEKVLRSRWAAIIAAGFIWGFGHATYPNQPFYIRGVEVGCAGVLIGFLMMRFGIVPLLIWHYTVDALYTAMLLLRSGNNYYIVSGALASLVFAIPMLVSIALYVRNKGFVPDDDLSNDTIPIKPVPERAPEPERPAFTFPSIPITRGKLAACIVLIALAIGAIALNFPSIDDPVDYRITKDDAKRIAATVGPPPAAAMRTIATPVEGFRSWDRGSTREEGGGPADFDSVAIDYLLRHGMSMQSLLTVMRTKIPTATWMVRDFAPQVKDEYFIEVDPRASRVAGYHKYQDERRAGPRLEQPQALAIAQAAFARFGADVRAFDLKEALNFQQPNRRDWLFHFQERTPLAADAWRRISVRVAGAEVTQFTTTVKVPDSVYREPTTLLNIVFTLLRVAGVLTILSLVVAGFVIALRRQRFPWQRALRWTFALAVIPLISIAARWDLTLFEYNTSITWQTFITNQSINIIRNVGLHLGAIFLAVAALAAAYPEAFHLARRDSRARLGRSAAIAALTAISIAVIFRVAEQAIALRFPNLTSIHGLNAPEFVAIRLPALLGIASTIIRTLLACAVFGLFIVALRGFSNRPWLPAMIGTTAIFLAALDASANLSETPLMLASAAVVAALAFIVIRYILGTNLLAYPLTIAVALLLGNGADLLQNHRQDLTINGIVEIVIAIGLLLWAAIARESAAAAGA
ncbi:MAG TPA: CPBP family glutamic-type intramembrane protease [Thermoanaerobaculia bacterium]|jgi:membrane protease YdiL (CAAX protease family)|nr:CPBP family glutamic-type intramembrane protease [Thermoanaerobaculia bacterium]